MDVNGQRMDLEVQVGDEGDYEDRCLYYWARAFSSALPAKGRYRDLPRTIVASIVAFKLFDCEEYYSEYMPMEVTRHTLLTDKERIIVFELPKLPKEVTADNGMELWLSLFRAKTVEELDALERMGVPEVQEAIHAYRDITVTPEFREAERLRSKARHDEAQAVYTAEQRGRQEGESSKAVDIAKKMLRRNRPLTEIIEDTGLNTDKISAGVIPNTPAVSFSAFARCLFDVIVIIGCSYVFVGFLIIQRNNFIDPRVGHIREQR